MPRLGRFTFGKETPVPIVQEGGWAPELVWKGGGKLVSTGLRPQDRPSRRQSLHQLSYSGPLLASSKNVETRSLNKFIKYSANLHCKMLLQDTHTKYTLFWETYIMKVEENYSKTINRKHYWSYAEYKVRKVKMRDRTLAVYLHKQRSSWRENVIIVSVRLFQSPRIVKTSITTIRW
jgi:hypothetical protein